MAEFLDKALPILNIIITVLAIGILPLLGWLIRKVVFPKWDIDRRARFLGVLDTIWHTVEILSEKTEWTGDDKLAEALKLLHKNLSEDDKVLAKAYLAAKSLEAKKK